MPTQPKTYTEEFKREAVRLAKERGNIAQTARDLGVSDTSILYWKKQLEEALNVPFPVRATQEMLNSPSYSANWRV